MIQDWKTNKVFLSNLLQPGLYNRIDGIFQKEGICCEYLPFTRDIFVRDFMPIQLSDNIFIQYRFYPDYLHGKGKFRTPKSSIDRICEGLNIKTKCSDIIIDGVNVTPCGKYIIMTDKVFTENGREKGDVVFTGMLEELLESEIIFIPWHKMKDDGYGHSDGIVKYAGYGRVLISNIAQDDEGKDLAKGIRRELERKSLDVVELHFDEKDPAFSYSWAYINFIQVGNVILMPALGTKQDNSAEEQISALFQSCRIHRINDMKRVLNLGGALHCISWNIKE